MSDEERIAELTLCLAHDLKSPIAAIISNAHFLLEDESCNKEASGAMRDILGATDSLHRLLLDLEAIAAHAGGKLTVRREEVVLHDLLSTLRAESREAASLRDHRFEIRVDPMGAVASVDRTLIARLLRNLIDNSISHAPPRSEIGIEASVGPEQRLELRVRDRGARVPADARELLFSRYGRVEREKLGRVGRGASLHFCKVASEVHGGSIVVDDDTPEGTLFRVVIPHA